MQAVHLHAPNERLKRDEVAERPAQSLRDVIVEIEIDSARVRRVGLHNSLAQSDEEICLQPRVLGG